MTCLRESDRNSQLPTKTYPWLETREIGWADWPLAKFRLKAQRCAGNSPTATIALSLKGVSPRMDSVTT